MAEAEATQAEGTEAEGGEQSAPEWQGAIEQLGEQFSSRFDEVANLIQSQQEQPEPESDDDYGYQPEFDAEQLYDDDGEMDPQAAQQLLQQMVGQHSQQAVQEAVGPLMERINNMEIQRQAESLEAEFPELQKEEVAGAVLQAAEQHAAEIGQPELGRNPAFVRVVYLAQKAADRAAGEVPAGTQPDGLEAAGGAVAPTPQVDPADGIVAARNRNSFWGA